MTDGVHVWDYVAKHGSHSQASHAGGKGGAGAAGGDSPEIKQAKEELDNNIIGAKSVQANAKNADDADMAGGAVKGFQDVKSSLGDKKAMGKVRTKRDALVGQLKSPMAPLQSGYRANYGYVQAATSALAMYGKL